MALKDSLEKHRNDGPRPFNEWLEELADEERNMFLAAVDDRAGYSLESIASVVRENNGRASRDTISAFRRDRERRG